MVTTVLGDVQRLAEEGGAAGGKAPSPAAAELWAALQRRLAERAVDGQADGAAAAAGAEGWTTAGEADELALDPAGAAEAALGAWLHEWLSASEPHLGRLERAGLVRSLWAAAMLQLQPPSEWLEALLGRATELVRRHRARDCSAKRRSGKCAAAPLDACKCLGSG